MGISDTAATIVETGFGMDKGLGVQFGGDGLEIASLGGHGGGPALSAGNPDFASPQAKLMLNRKRMIAYHRFGLGAKPGSFARMKDPKAALLRELKTSGIARIKKTTALPTYAEACKAGEMAAFSDKRIHRAELDARFKKHCQVPIGFVERLVLLFCNHFSMANRKRQMIEKTIGQLERDVIRKHVLGKFPNMLVGVMQHPAMMAMLDNRRSIGPNSKYGLNNNAGNNQNLAREIMELYTIGSGGGYTQDDVVALSLIMTGWTSNSRYEAENNQSGATMATVGQFRYRHDWQEPGPITFRGKSYPYDNLAEGHIRATGGPRGIAVLRHLALQRQTAEHLAFKMIRHFITDRPTPSMVKPLADAYMKSGGSIKQMAIAMLNRKAAWSWPLKKFRTPYEWQVAQYRALRNRHVNYLGSDEKEKANPASFEKARYNLRYLNHTVWECIMPDGYSDETPDWLSPDALRVRINAAWSSVNAYHSPAKYSGSASQLARGIFGKSLSKASRSRIAALPNVKQGITLLFLTPEFQRR